MEGFAKEVCKRLPLAEAVFRLFDFVANKESLEAIFERHRGRSYEDVIRFPVFVDLIGDALLQYEGSGNRSFEKGQEKGQLEATIRAAYGKLERVPVSLSIGFFTEATQRLEEVFPATKQVLPKSLRRFDVLAIDGKKIKHLAKRLKPLRKVRGHVLGGKVVAALSLRTNMAVGLAAHPDGEISDAPLVPDVLQQVRATRTRPRLWIGDRQYCDLTQPAQFALEGDHFLIRYNAKVSFHRDRKRSVKEGVDENGCRYREEWGWLGAASDKRRRYVRRITLFRKEGENIILVTDLLDDQKHPAAELLSVYKMRWGIECVFQRVTEVFHLKALISSTPRGTVFQAAFCFLLYNMIQVIRGYIASSQNLEPEEISIEKLFLDSTRQMISWTEILSTQDTVTILQTTWSASRLTRRLTVLLRNQWSERWRKTPTRKSKPQKHDTEYLEGGHDSAFRILKRARNRAPARE